MVVLTTEATAPRPTTAPRFWALMSCPRCAGAILLEINSPNETPPKAKLIVPEDERVGAQVAHLPPDVERFYRDAQRVLDADVPDAAAVQLRKTLEAAAGHFGIKDGPLVARIEKLIDQGLITKGFGKVLDHVRLLGNVGAYAADQTVDEASARKALRFTTQVLRNLFEISAELEAPEPKPEAR